MTSDVNDEPIGIEDDFTIPLMQSQVSLDHIFSTTFPFLRPKIGSVFMRAMFVFMPAHQFCFYYSFEMTGIFPTDIINYLPIDYRN